MGARSKKGEGTPRKGKDGARERDGLRFLETSPLEKPGLQTPVDRP